MLLKLTVGCLSEWQTKEKNLDFFFIFFFKDNRKLADIEVINPLQISSDGKL